jgi:hypothetical protein
LAAQGGKEITQTKEKIIKEVEVEKETSQKTIVAWKSR